MREGVIDVQSGESKEAEVMVKEKVSRKWKNWHQNKVDEEMFYVTVCAFTPCDILFRSMKISHISSLCCLTLIKYQFQYQY